MLLTQTLSSTHKLALSKVAIIALTFAIAGCRQQSKQDNAAVTASPTGSTASPGVERSASTSDAETSTLVPVVDLDSIEAQQLNKPWTGDFNEQGERRFIRALVAINKTSYFIDRADQRGIAYESLAEFEKSLRSNSATRHLTTKITIIPTTRDRLLPALAAGYGDIAIGNLTITPEREKLVDFSDLSFAKQWPRSAKRK